MSTPSVVDDRAVELFDELGNTLLLLARRLDGLLDDDMAPKMREELQRTRLHVVDALHTLRQATDSLDTNRFVGAPLQEALQRMVRSFSPVTDSMAEVRTTGPVHRLPDGLRAIVLHVARETMVNLVQHGRATIVLVTLTVDDTELALDIRDDGADLGQRQWQRHGLGWRSATELGLATMARTVKATGGRLTVVACRPRGLNLQARIPLRMAP